MNLIVLAAILRSRCSNLFLSFVSKTLGFYGTASCVRSPCQLALQSTLPG